MLFGAGGPYSCRCLEGLISVAEVVAVVVPRTRGRGLWKLLRTLVQRRRTAALRQIARRTSIPVLAASDDLSNLRCDLLCTASFPEILNARIRGIATLGAINVHSSLLPRHRGPDPIFWTYHDDDRETGVTVHWLTHGVDDGDVILQRRLAIPRGLPGTELYGRLSVEAATGLSAAVTSIVAGSAERRAQPPAGSEPHSTGMTWSIDYSSWPAERLWHFLRGIAARRNAVIPDRNGRWFRIGGVVRHEESANNVPAGTIERRGKVLTIYCLDGVVTVRKA